MHAPALLIRDDVSAHTIKVAVAAESPMPSAKPEG